MMKSVLLVLVATLLLLLLVPVVCGQTCRSYTKCTDCLEDPECGWCAQYGNCVLGSASGPSEGACKDWDYYSCSSTESSSSSAHSSPAASSSSVAPPEAVGLDWPMYGGSPARSGFRAVFVSGSPSEVWRSSHGGSYCSSSIIVNGTLYATSADGSYDVVAYLSGLSVAEAGKQVTYVLLGAASSFSAPAAGNNSHYNTTAIAVVLVGTDEGISVPVVRMDTQKLAWSGTSGSQWASYPYGALVVPGGNVYYLDGEYNGLMSGYGPSGSRLFDTSLYSTDFGCDYSAPSAWSGSSNVYWTTAPGEGDTAMFGATDGNSGKSKYTVTLAASWDGYSTYTLPVIDEKSGVALVTHRLSGTLLLTAIDLASGKELWSNTSCSKPSQVDYTPATDGSIVALACASEIMTWELATGTISSTYNCPGCHGQPLLTTNKIFVSSGQGTVMLDRNSGDMSLFSAESGTLSLSGDLLFITLSDCTVVAYSISG